MLSRALIDLFPCFLFELSPLNKSYTSLSFDRWHSPNMDLSDLTIVGTCDILVYQMHPEVTVKPV